MRDTPIMPELTDAVLGPITEELVDLGPAGRLVISRPGAPERLLDLESVASAYEQDEYMPYWATIWPVARELARALLSEPAVDPAAGLTAIELGCGLALPGIAALRRGYHVTFTDWDPTTLRFAARNAALNDGGTFRTLALDWRAPHPDTYDLVIASDLTYERRNVEPLVKAFTTLTKPGGRIVLADQNRAYAPELKAALAAAGFAFTCESVRLDPASGVSGEGTIYRISLSPEAAVGSAPRAATLEASLVNQILCSPRSV